MVVGMMKIAGIVLCLLMLFLISTGASPSKDADTPGSKLYSNLGD